MWHPHYVWQMETRLVNRECLDNPLWASTIRINESPLQSITAKPGLYQDQITWVNGHRKQFFKSVHSHRQTETYILDGWLCFYWHHWFYAYRVWCVASADLLCACLCWCSFTHFDFPCAHVIIRPWTQTRQPGRVGCNG